jgi:hypothetical protein
VLFKIAYRKNKATVVIGCPHVTLVGKEDRAKGERIMLVFEIGVEKLTRGHQYNWGAVCYTFNEMVHHCLRYKVAVEKINQFRILLKERCEKERKEAVLSEFRKIPCKGCGNPFHGLLEYCPLERKHKYACPCMVRVMENPTSWYEDERRGYRLCPQSVASQNGYDLERTSAAMNRFEHRGAGKFNSPSSNEKLRKEALDICNNYQNRAGVDSNELRKLRRICPTKIISIEGWDYPREDSKANSKEPAGTSNPNNEGDEEEYQKTLVMVSLLILVILLFSLSQEVSDGSTNITGMTLYPNNEEGQSLQG